MKTVIVTGASKGIGFATANKFLVEGWRVIGTSRSGKIDILNYNFTQIKLDLSIPENIIEAAKEISGHREVDVLINNAAVKLEDETLGIDVNILRQTLEVNLIGTIHFTTLITPLIKNEGSIVNISSKRASLSFEGSGTNPAYRISKTALNMFTRTLAKSLAIRDINVSSLDPGWVSTDLGGVEAPRTPNIPAEEIFNLISSKSESGLFWFKGERAEW